MKIAKNLQIPFIDIADVFAHDPDPDTLYAYPGAHCSPRGYRLAASAIADALAPVIGKTIRGKRNYLLSKTVYK